jgi:nucleotide-binding universal stress UspA family protein
MNAMERIVIGVDGSDEARVALAWAYAEARLRGWALEVVMASEDDRSGDESSGVLEREVRAVAGPSADVLVSTAVEEGHPAQELVRRAADAELLVVGSRGLGGFKGLLLGSVSQACLTHATGTVAVVPRTTSERRGPVVVGIDGSVESLAALHWAVGEARLRGAVLELLHAQHYPEPLDFWEVSAIPQAHPTIEDRLRTLVEESEGELDDLEVVLTVVEAHPTRALLDGAGDAALVVVGARGHGGFTGLLLGSTSVQIASHAPCPVVVARDRG